MRKSILVTAAIAVTAGALALAFSQTEQGKTFFTAKQEQTTSEMIASAITPEATLEEETTTAEATTPEAITETTTTAAATSETPVRTVEGVVPQNTGDEDEATMAPTTATTTEAAAGGMTLVDLDKAPTSTAAATTDTATLNAQAPAAGEAVAESADKTTLKQPKTEYKFDVATALKDRSIGSENAPVTVYDFSSLTCPHCAHFHNDVFPKIKTDYIDTGKVRWVFHGFPLNEPALKGEMIARCAPNDQYTKLQDLMYKNQERWAFSEEAIANLSMLLRLAGITDDMFLSCVNNTDLQAGLLKKYQEEGEKFKISSTPTFVFNDGEKTFSGAGTYEGFAFDLDALLKQAAAKKAAPATPAK